MNKVREEFEKTYLSLMNPYYFENEEQKLVYLKVDCNSNYVHDCTRLAYLWFVKGRETITIELPKNCEGMALTVSEFKQQLNKAGIKYE